MKAFAFAALAGVALLAMPILAQDGDSSEIVVTAQMRTNASGVTITMPAPPVIGLKRQADSAVRNIEIVSDSRDEDMRKREVQAMLFAAIDRAKREGLFLVTGEYELVEVTHANWKEQFLGLAEKVDAEENDDEDENNYDDDDDNKPKLAFEDDGSTTTIRLKLKTKLDGSIGDAQKKIASFAKSVPVTGRSQISQKGGLSLTIINPEQYRDEIYRRIADGAKHSVSFYGIEYGVDVTGLDKAIAWKQVSNTEVFLYIPYEFSIGK
jgi:hypothetical protein